MNLIPFAFHQETEQIIDIADVPNGRSCNCICPSCKQPLIARKGTINEWHFAHDAKFESEEARLDCQYSWFIAIKMMLKQIILDGSVLTLPSYIIKLQHDIVPLEITRESAVKYKVAGKAIQGYDIVIKVDSHKIGLLLTKSVPIHFKLDNRDLDGVLALELDKLIFNKEEFKTMTEYLKSYIEKSTLAKKWLYHAREVKIIHFRTAELARGQLTTNLFKSKQQKLQKIANQYFSNKEPQVEKCIWHCIMCNFDYEGLSKGENPCPKCNSHLYRTPK